MNLWQRQTSSIETFAYPMRRYDAFNLREATCGDEFAIPTSSGGKKNGNENEANGPKCMNNTYGPETLA